MRFCFCCRTEDNAEHTVNGLYLLPQDISEETCRQLCAEVYIEPDERHKRGYWKKLRDRNEALDCTNYATACFYLLGAYKFSPEQWDTIEEKLKANIDKTERKHINRATVQSQIQILNQGMDI